MLRGIGVSPGIATGPAVVLRRELPRVEDRAVPPEAIEGEVGRLLAAVDTVRRSMEDLRGRAQERVGPEEAKIFDAQILMLEDRDFLNGVERLIRDNQLTAERAFEFKALEVRALWANSGSQQLRDRVADLSGLQIRVLNHLLGREVDEQQPLDADRPAIVFTRELTPGLTLQFEREQVAGFVSDRTRSMDGQVGTRSRGFAGGLMNDLRRGGEALEALRSIPLFSSVSDEDLQAIASLLIERRFPKHKTIVEEGLPGDYMYIIAEGRVQVSKLSNDGREKILEFLDAGDFFGEMSLLDNAPRSASVRALVESRVLALSRSDFLAVMRRSSDLAMAVVQELTRRLRHVDEQASSLSFQRVKERTQGLLVRLAREDDTQPGRRVTPALTHQQIADMIGTSRETVTRALKGLKEHGWLRQEGKKYLVPVDD